MVNKIIEKICPLYIRLWPSWYWIAIWSVPMKNLKETEWEALRITIRYGIYHSELRKVIKKGIIY